MSDVKKMLLQLRRPNNGFISVEEAMETREQKANRFKRESRKLWHTNDCSTSIAPAEEPGPCDCEVPMSVKRWDKEPRSQYVEDGEEMKESAFGDWVEYADYAVLEHRALVAERALLNELESGVMPQDHSDAAIEAAHQEVERLAHNRKAEAARQLEAEKEKA